MVTGVISFCPRPTVHRLGLNPGLLGIDRLLLKISQLCCVQFASLHSATGHTVVTGLLNPPSVLRQP